MSSSIHAWTEMWLKCIFARGFAWRARKQVLAVRQSRSRLSVLESKEACCWLGAGLQRKRVCLRPKECCQLLLTLRTNTEHTHLPLLIRPPSTLWNVTEVRRERRRNRGKRRKDRTTYWVPLVKHTTNKQGWVLQLREDASVSLAFALHQCTHLFTLSYS